MPALVKNVRSVLLSTRQIAPGTFTTPDWDVPQGVSRFYAALNRSTWADTGADVVKITVEESTDGGLTWRTLAGFTAKGGAALDKLGNVLTKSEIVAPLTPGTKVRAQGQVFSTITTQLEFEVR